MNTGVIFLEGATGLLTIFLSFCSIFSCEEIILTPFFLLLKMVKCVFASFSGRTFLLF